RRSLGGPKPSENYEHRRPKSFTVYPNAGLKAAEVWKSRSPPRTTSIAPRKVLRSLPQREIESRRFFRWPQPSENDYHRSTETFWEVYPKARLEAAKI
ncbi:hypothetical protein NPIL_424861, partial [Nephila pilipes]